LLAIQGRKDAKHPTQRQQQRNNPIMDHQPITQPNHIQNHQETNKPMEPRPIYEIAREIRRSWNPVNYAAKPYLDAMTQLSTITEKYGYDSAKSVILYFLSNAASWRGDTAKRIKAELKTMVGNR